METFKETLIRLDACSDAIKWAGDKTFEEVLNTCERGDWLIWLHYRVCKDDNRSRILAAGHCANTVRHLMKDERRIKAVDAAIAYGEGLLTNEELAAYAEAYAYAEHVTNTAYAYNDAARIANRKATADICRKYLKWDLFTSLTNSKNSIK